MTAAFRRSIRDIRLRCMLTIHSERRERRDHILALMEALLFAPRRRNDSHTGRWHKIEESGSDLQAPKRSPRVSGVLRSTEAAHCFGVFKPVPLAAQTRNFP